MKIKLSNVLMGNLRLLMLFLFLVPSLRAKTLDRVVATVDNEVITLSELEEAVSLYQMQLGNTPKAQESTKDQDFKRRMLEELINKRLVEEFAAKSGIQASEEEVDRAIEDVLSRNRLTKERLGDALKQDGLSYDEYRKQIQDQIVKAKLINREIRPNINVTDDAVREYYLNHPEKFRADPGVVLKHILFRLPANSDEKTLQDVEKKAVKAREEILKGKPFEVAAQQYSQDQATANQGGALGFFRMGDLTSEFKAALSLLKEGEVSEPVRTSTGIHLIKLEERTTGTVRPFEKVKEDIQSRLFEDQGEHYFQNWIKDLRKNAFIEILQ
jgi:peptidyl-prolyl cis-trans isomerase SurA